MVDNFDQIEKLLNFEKKGDCYYVQLLRRQSDDPMTNGRPDPAYHGNMYSRSLKDYLISSIEQFRDLRKEMVTLCNTFNVRAYIRLNKRNYKNISTKMLKQIADQIDSGETYCSPYRLIASAIGTTCQAGKDKTWIVDCDACHMGHIDAVVDMVHKCEPYISGQYSDQEIPRIPTKHGIHLITHPFNKQAFNTFWDEYVKSNNLANPLPQWKMDTERTHFSFTGFYLKHIAGFISILEQNAFKHTIDKIDKNKTIIHLDNNTYNFDILDIEWKRYCLSSQFYLDAPQIHTDNPTCLYFP